MYVSGMVDNNGLSVGVPNELEARKYLVLSNGDVMAAGKEVYLFRKKKVDATCMTSTCISLCYYPNALC